MLFGALGLLLSKKMPKALDVALKALVVFFYVVGFFRLMLSDAFPVTVINGGMYGGVKVKNVDYLQFYFCQGNRHPVDNFGVLFYILLLTLRPKCDSIVYIKKRRLKMEIINAHAHIYPEKIAAKATDTIGVFYDIKMNMPAGTAERLIEDGKRAGTDRYVVHSVATTAHQVRSINEFIKREVEAHPEFIGFITLHQDLSEEEIFNEVDWAIENGFHGIKLHPDFQKFNIDDEAVEKFYRAAEGRLPILFHVGDDRYEYSKPRRLVRMAKKYPRVQFIAAHFGGYRCWDDAELYRGLPNVYFDTCSSLPFISTDRAKEIIDMLGADRFFYATDFPMWDSVEELERFYKIPLTDTVREMILGGNIKRLLNL